MILWLHIKHMILWDKDSIFGESPLFIVHSCNGGIKCNRNTRDKYLDSIWIQSIDTHRLKILQVKLEFFCYSCLIDQEYTLPINSFERSICNPDIHSWSHGLNKNLIGTNTKIRRKSHNIYCKQDKNHSNHTHDKSICLNKITWTEIFMKITRKNDKSFFTLIKMTRISGTTKLIIRMLGTKKIFLLFFFLDLLLPL